MATPNRCLVRCKAPLFNTSKKDSMTYCMAILSGYHSGCRINGLPVVSFTGDVAGDRACANGATTQCAFCVRDILEQPDMPTMANNAKTSAIRFIKFLPVYKEVSTVIFDE